MKTLTKLLTATAMTAAATPARAGGRKVGYADGLFRHQLPFGDGRRVCQMRHHRHRRRDRDRHAPLRHRCSPAPQIKRAIQTGQVPIGERLLSGHQNENALFGFDSIPFLATSFDDADKLWKAAKAPLDRSCWPSQNLTLLYSVPWPPQGLYFKNEVNSVADMEGHQVPRPTTTPPRGLAELTGMLPVTIEAAEISQAFATGVADSMISSGSTGYDRKVWESLNYFYEVDAWLPRNYVMVNTDVWGGVSRRQQGT